MLVKKLPIKTLLLISTFFGGCVTAPIPSDVKTLTHERLIIRDKAFIRPLGTISPTIPFPQERLSSSRENGEFKTLEVMGMATIGAIVPKILDKGLDIVGKAIVQASGKGKHETSISANASNFFFKDNNYNYFNATEQPEFNLIFISGQFGNDRLKKWRPRVDKAEIDAFRRLNISGKPNFYLEAKIFPLTGNKYMEVVPTYMYYNRPLNSQGGDKKRDLLIRFTFNDMNEALISQAQIVFKDVAYGHEYLDKDLSQTRTTFMKIPSISPEQKGYSGAFNLKVDVMETRDINQWLAAFGESLLESKEEIKSALPLISKEEKITARTNYLQSRKDVEIVQSKINALLETDYSQEELLTLEKALLQKEGERDKLRLLLK